MKRILGLMTALLIVLMPLLLTSAEMFDGRKTITVNNNKEFAKLLSKNWKMDEAKEFFEKYGNELIEFDGNIAYLDYHENYKTRYDWLIYVGDYDPAGKNPGPLFQFRDKNINNLNLIGSNIPDSLGVGLNLHIVAAFDYYGYNEDTGMFYLNPIQVTIRD